MKANPLGGITRPSLPTLSDIQRRMVELTGKQLHLEPQTQLQTRPAPSTPPQPSEFPDPILAEAALYGVAGLAVCGLAPHSEAHPAAILLQLLAAFGNAVGPAPHLPLPSNSFVSLGKRNAGPNPKTIPPHTGSLGEREKALGDVTQPLLHPTEPSLEVFDNVVW